MNKKYDKQSDSGFPMSSHARPRFLLSAATAVALCGSLYGATWTVTTPDDSTDTSCDANLSLREAVSCAAAGDVIDFNTTEVVTILSNAGGTITLNNSITISGPITISAQESALFNVSAQDVNLNNVQISNGGVSSMTYEPMISVVSGGSLRLQDSNVSDNYLNYYNVIQNQGTLTIVGSEISNNSGYPMMTSSPIGNSGSLTIENSRLTQNNSDNGGAINQSSGTAVITGSILSDNNATSDGGAIYVSGGSMSIESSTLSGNSTTMGGGGGAIANYAGDFNISNTSLDGNWASNYGGGAIMNINGTVRLTRSSVSNNGVYGYGGGIESLYGTLEINSTTISDNYATYEGGGIYQRNGNISMVESLLSGNYTEYSGGGIYVVNGAMNIKGSTLRDNNASTSGGGIEFSFYNGEIPQSVSILVEESTLQQNYAGTDGGGIHAVNSDSLLQSIGIKNSTISGNHAAGSGGGLMLENTYTYAYGTSNMDINISHSTIASNIAVTGSGVNVSDVNLTIKNTILGDNTDESNTSNDCYSNIAINSYGYNLVETNAGCSGFGASGDLIADPGLLPLANNGGPTWTHALDITSLARFSGTNLDILDINITTDQRGYARQTPTSIGAFEPQGGNITLDSYTQDFGSVYVGTSSSIQTISVYNTGESTLTIDTVTLQNATAEFSVANYCSDLDPGMSCAVAVTFAPSAVGAYTDYLTIGTSGGIVSLPVTLTGLGAIAPEVSISTPSIDFGATIAQTSTDEANITLSNPSGVDITLDNLSLINGTNFGVISYCAGDIVPAGSSCTVGVTFTPSGDGVFSDTLEINNTTWNINQSISLTGTGLADTDNDGIPDIQDAFPNDPSASVDADGDGFPDAWNVGYTQSDFGLVLDTNVGVVNAYMTYDPLVVALGTVPYGGAAYMDINITNTGSTDLNISSFDFSGTDAGDFNLSDTNCSFSGGVYTITSGSSCYATVGFSATASGDANASLDIFSNYADANSSITLSAYVAAAVVTLDSYGIDFGTIATGQVSAETNITVTNTGDWNLTISDLTHTDGNFSITNYCPAQLEANANCTIGVVFAPSAEINATDTLQIVSNDPTSPTSVVLSGSTFVIGGTISGTITLPSGYTGSATVRIFVQTADGNEVMGTAFILNAGETQSFTLILPAGLEVFRVGYMVENSSGSLLQRGYFSGNATSAYSDEAAVYTMESLPTGINLSIVSGYTISGTVTLPNPVSGNDTGLDITASSDLLGTSVLLRHRISTRVNFAYGTQSADFNLTVPLDDVSAKYFLGYEFFNSTDYLTRAYYDSNTTTTTPYFSEAVAVDTSSGDQSGVTINVPDGTPISGTLTMETPLTSAAYLLVRAVRDDGYEIFGGVDIAANASSVAYTLDVATTEVVDHNYTLGYYLLEPQTPKISQSAVIGYWTSSGTVNNAAEAESFTVSGTTEVSGKDMNVLATAVQGLSVNAGWNLLSLPSKADFTAVDMALHFGFETDKITTLTKYGRNGWSYYMTKNYNVTVNRFNSLRSGEGFWLNASQAFTLPVAVADDPNYADEIPSLYTGWNLIGVNHDMSAIELITKYAAMGYSTIESIWIYHNGVWQVHIPNAALDMLVDTNIQRISTISRFDGVWVNLKGAN